MFLSTLGIENDLTKSSSSSLNPQRSDKFFFQPKLAINTPGDAYEQEADTTADRIMRMSSNENSFFKPGSAYIHRKENSSSGISAGSSTESYLSSIGNSGSSLPHATRKFFEPRFGHDFSDVKIHNDSRAQESAQEVNALAYTHGNNIVFGANQFSLENDKGKKLLAHELTHVVQQNQFFSTAPRKIQRAPNAQSPLPQIDERNNLGIYGSKKLYDARLNRKRKHLTLIIRVHLNYTGSWPDLQAKLKWQHDFIKFAHDAWSYQYMLVPEKSCQNDIDNATAELIIIPTMTNPHFTVNVSNEHLATGDAGTNTTPALGTANLHFSDIDLQKNIKNEIPIMKDGKRTGVKTEYYKHRPSDHEVGHMLGLDHPLLDPYTKAVVPKNPITGEADDHTVNYTYGEHSPLAADIMGFGEFISPHDYAPFLSAMNYFTSCNWKVKS